MADALSTISNMEVQVMRGIMANFEILGGQPIVEGTRLSVDHILGLLAHGMSHTEIVEAYPELTISRPSSNMLQMHFIMMC
jgi:uncharacterized protein (DUF433 family)